MPPARKSTPPEEKPASFEQSLAELEAIVENLESGQLPLNELIDQYEKGSRLFSTCDNLLGQARARLELITLKTKTDHLPTPGSSNGSDADGDDASDDDDIRLF